MFQRILVPLDGSSRAERAIPVAARLARVVGGSIVFVRVVVPLHQVAFYGAGPIAGIGPSVFQADIAEAREYLSAVVTSFREELWGIKTEGEVESGEIPSVVLSEAGLKHCDLIVLCSHGDVGLKRWVLNSVAQQTIRHSPIPVLILNEHDAVHTLEATAHPLSVLIPLDGSPMSEAMLKPAVELMTAFSSAGQGTLHLLGVLDTPYVNGDVRSHMIDAVACERARRVVQDYLERVAKSLQAGLLAHASIDVTTSVVTNTDVSKTIMKQAEETGCDLIAIATHGRGGLMRLLMGSVAEQVLGHTQRPLLVVRPPEFAMKQKTTHDQKNEEPALSSLVGLRSSESVRRRFS